MNIANQPPANTYKSWLTLETNDMQPSAKRVEDGAGVASSVSLGAQEFIMHEEVYAPGVPTRNDLEQVLCVETPSGFVGRRSLTSIQNAILTAINNQLNAITQDITDLQNDVNDLQLSDKRFLRTDNALSASLQKIKRDTQDSILELSDTEFSVNGKTTTQRLESKGATVFSSLPNGAITDDVLTISSGNVRQLSNANFNTWVNGNIITYLNNLPQYYYRKYSPIESTAASAHGITSVTNLPNRLTLHVSNNILKVNGYIFIPDGRTDFNVVSNTTAFNTALHSPLFDSVTSEKVVTKPIIPSPPFACEEVISETRICLYRHVVVNVGSVEKVLVATGTAVLKIDSDYKIHIYFNDSMDTNDNHFNANKSIGNPICYNNRLITFRNEGVFEAGSYNFLFHGFNTSVNSYFDVRPSTYEYVTTGVNLNTPMQSAGAFIHVDLTTHIYGNQIRDIKQYFESI